MSYYECVFIARQDIPSSQVESLTETFTSILTENGGKVEKTEYWGLKSLAYRIKKNRKGHYVLLNIDAPHPAVAEMERQMGINEDILRNLTIRVEALEEEPSAMMQSRPSREGRPGRDGGSGRDRDGGGRDRDSRDRGDRPPREPREASRGES
ncbi:MAG: 30S ribosomal protein S6 [Inquilinaceae bacterium]